MPDPAAVAAETDRLGVVAISVTNAPSVFSYGGSLPRFAASSSSVGLHPELVASHHGELSLFVEQLPLTKFVGEIGLDLVTNDASLRVLQRKVFASIVSACSDAGDKVLTVHSRRAATAVLDELGLGFKGAVILHWFSGTKRELLRAVDAGCFFSVNSVMLASKTGRSLIEAMPRERVLTETDGPFVSVRGRPARPWNIKSTINDLASLWNCSDEDAVQSISQSFERVMQRDISLITHRQ